MTHDTREVEEWEVIKTDIHSPFLVMLHSTLINRSVYKTSGEMAQAVIKVFEEYAAPSLLHYHLQKAREEERERIAYWCKMRRETIKNSIETWEVVDYEELIKTIFSN